MTVTTITTVGYREVHPLSRAGAGVHGRAHRRRRRHRVLHLHAARHHRGRRRPARDAVRATAAHRMLDELKDHFIVCGYGRIGSIIVEEFRRQHVPYVVIERDRRSACTAVIERGRPRRRSRRQPRRGAEARGHRPRPGAHRRGRHRCRERLHRADRARAAPGPLHHRPRRDRGRRAQAAAGRGRTASSRPTASAPRSSRRRRCGRRSSTSSQLATSSEHLELAIEQVTIGDAQPLAGQSIIDANLRQRFGADRRSASSAAGGRMEFNPPGDAVMQAGDQLVVLGRGRRAAPARTGGRPRDE